MHPEITALIEKIWTEASANTGTLLAVVPIILSILAGIFALIKYVWAHFKNRTATRNSQKVKVSILNPKDAATFDELIDLYRRRIDPINQVDIELFRAWYVDHRIRNEINNTILVARASGQVAGFMQLMWSQKDCTLFVTYLAVDETSLLGRTRTAKALINYARKKLNRKCGDLKHFAFEVEKPTLSRGSQNEKAQRDVARLRRLKQLCKECGMWVREVDTTYIQPEIPNESGVSNQHEMLLVLAGREKLGPERIQKATYLAMLRFIYKTIYARVFRGDPDLARLYDDELDRLLNVSHEVVPDMIRLVP